MNNLLQRTLTGALFTGLVIVSLLVSQYMYGIVFCALMIISLLEFFNMRKSQTSLVLITLSIVVAFVSFVSTYLHASGKINENLFLIFIPLYLVFLILVLFQKKTSPFESLGVSFLGLIYIGIPFIVLNYMMFTTNGIFTGKNVLGILIVIWIYDSGAYVFGIWLGKNRLFERISPKKSWEGAIGGLIVSVVASIFLSYFFNELTFIQRIILTVLIVISSTLGDLTESMLKRASGIKDSGKILPGHGGILDRIDSILFAIPVVFIYFEFIKYI